MGWRSADSVHDARYRALLATWELSGRALDPAELHPPPVEDIIRRAERADAGGGAYPRGVKLRPRFRLRAAIFVTGLAAAAGLAALLVIPAGLPVPPDASALRVAAEEDARSIQLADGTLVRLARGATLRYDPEAPRNVWLEGRAFFGVSADRAHPFFVHTTAGVTRVLGTRFDVRADSGSLSVTVVEGRVQVHTASGDVELGRGQQTRAVPDSAPVVHPADPDALADWMDGVFIFQATTLGVALEELERRFGRDLAIVDPVLRDRTVTAVFDDFTLEQILPALCRAVDAECVEAGGTVLFTLRKSFQNP